MRLHPILAIFYRQLYLIRGSFTRVMPLFIWVAIDIVLWGFMTRYLNSIASPGFNFIPALLGAILLWDFFTRVMHGVSMAFLEDVWSRNFLNIFATPLTLGEYLAGLVLTSILTGAIGLGVMIVLATSLFHLSLFTYGAALIPFLLVLFMFGIALGIFAAGLVLRFGPAAEWFMWPIPALISPFAGVFYPLSTLPEWMQTVAHIFPAGYVFENLRAIVKGGEASFGALAIGGGLAVLYILAACGFFTLLYHHAVKSGLIARYSAENVS